MKKRIISWLKYIGICFIFFTIGTQTIFAEVNVNYLDDMLNGIVTPKTMNESDKPFLADRYLTDEVIDPQSGTLSLKVNDLSLPGRDGLDFNLTRIYDWT